MHQSVILVASASDNIDAYLKKNLPQNYQLFLVEDHVKDKGITKAIFVDDIREIRDSLITNGFKGANKVFVLRDAALMRVEAQNALLKHLEEPAENIYFVLVTPTPNTLLETVRSRCVTVVLPREITKSDDPQIAFISRGDAAEMKRLSKNKAYLKKRTDTYSQAKVLVGGSMLDKLKIITEISSNREHSLEVIDAALHIIQVQMKSNPDPGLVQRADKLTTAYDRIAGYASIKLQLTNSVL